MESSLDRLDSPEEPLGSKAYRMLSCVSSSLATPIFSTRSTSPMVTF